MQIPKAAERIIEQLNQAGFEAYVVGGCVRDTLLGKEPEDWDITTSAKPEQVKAIFGRTIDTGIQHGTVTIMKGKEGFEVTTYRIDGEYEDGRHPKSVEFTSNLVEDLKRRDFTINAMAYSHASGLVDAFDGLKDLEEHRIRCVGNPIHRFTEDALRILRAIRFSAQLGFEIEAETKKAISVLAPNLIHVSKERIQVELTKLLLSENPEFIRMVYETGISPYISEAFDQLPKGEIRINRSLPAAKAIRWAAFLRLGTEETAAKILKDLKMDNDTIFKTKTLAAWCQKPMEADKTAVRRVMSQMPPDLYDDLLVLRESLATAECRTQLEGAMAEQQPGTALAAGELETLNQIKTLRDEIRQAGDCISLKMLAVTGGDLIQAGMKPGKQMGQTLERLFQLVLEHPEWNKKEYLLSSCRENGWL